MTCRSLIYIVLSIIPFLSEGRNIYVKPDQTGLALTKAINLANDGDSILVYPGTYYTYELHVNKRVHLKGLHFPVLDGKGRGNMVIMEVPYSSIEGFVIQNSGISGYNDIAALRIINTRRVRVENNRFVNNFFSIYNQNSNGTLIKGNKIISNATSELMSANGIHCWKSDSLTIFNNYIKGHRDGIYFEFVKYSLIQGNISEYNVRYGLHFMFSHEDIYKNNTFKNNGAGVSVMYSKKVTMTANTFIENWGNSAFGMLIKDIDDCEIRGNTFKRNTCGIFMEGGNRVMILNNKFDANGWAIKIQANCTENKINKNNFIRNSFDIATNGNLVLNNFDSNFWDQYKGYDLNKDGTGDVPFRPVSMYSMIIESNPTSLMLYRSFLVQMLDEAERMVPGFTPELLIDNYPKMKAYSR